MHTTDLLDTVLITSTSPTITTTTALQKDSPDTKSVFSTLTGTNSTMPPEGTSAGGDQPATCPVDHKTREEWLRQARAAQAAQAAAQEGGAARPTLSEQQFQHPPLPTTAAAAAAQQDAQPTQQPSAGGWSSLLKSSLPFGGQPQIPQPSAAAAVPQLGEDREVSSIPRSTTSPPQPGSRPSNHEIETAPSPTGNWIYPSEKMFFEAMRRKGFAENSAADMKTVVPIHNAVNERAWKEILQWEKPYTENGKCGDGPKLESFAGLSDRMTPKARINTLLGYQPPFDRHDWIVDRCGTKVEYVIDFYAGRQQQGQQKLNFYLDVRPKLNTWEGVKMRVLRGVGLA